ncbi:hypothetical protein PFAG_04128 [Plasmodium falciparum Santa Lucia]|uniref:Kinesin motor domain-containing protein n=1 Tax=Plasmodium falciparum Santa Lucia TaxID=478859 RepID=W7FUT8_PLAFA|nr:hypothetical protein PFAG_04128 [Plasmodium falciparum Santa Lucia]
MTKVMTKVMTKIMTKIMTKDNLNDKDKYSCDNNININNNNSHINNSSHNPHSNTCNIHIPYRDSKLTRVLSDSLGNNCKSILICTLSSKLQYLNETASTIKFAQRAKMVKAKPIVREEKVENKKEADTNEKEKNMKKKKKKRNEEKNDNNGDDYKEDNYDDDDDDDDDEKNNLYDNKLNIFLNFNKNHITKDIIFFCFSLCIFSYICGFKSTGKVKYLDFFIESYKNKIDIIKEQLNKSNESNKNDINEYLMKTFDDLKVLTEEERQRNMKLNMEKLKKCKDDNKNTINQIQKKQENEEHALTIRNLAKVDPTLISKYDIQKKYQHNNNDVYDEGVHYLNVDDNNNDDVHADNNDETHIHDNDNDNDDDVLIGDILVKMKNDICNIIKFNLTSLKCNRKENDEIFEEILHIVNSVKENNDIFLINELKNNSKDEKINKKKDAQGDKINIPDDNNNNNNNNKISFKSIKNMNIVKKYLKKDDVNKNKNTKSILNINHKDDNKCYQDNNDNDNYITGDDKNMNNNIKNKNDILHYQVFAQKILSVTNIQNIFNYVNHNYTKFISDFTTDKSTVFSNFDLKENLDRQIIEKNNTIYNFIHSATMFQHSQTLKNLNSNYFINKIQTEIYNNYPHIIHMKYMPSINNNEPIITERQNDLIVTTPLKNILQINKEYNNTYNTHKYIPIKDIIPDHTTNQNETTCAINKSVTFFNEHGGNKHSEEDLSNKNNIPIEENKKEINNKSITFLRQSLEGTKNKQDGSFSNIAPTNKNNKNYDDDNNKNNKYDDDDDNNNNNNNINNDDDNICVGEKKHIRNHAHKDQSYEVQNKKDKNSKKKGSFVHNINVSDKSDNSLEFTKLLEDKDFKKLYEYLIEKENTNDVNTFIQKEEHMNNALNELECKINSEIRRVSDHIVVDYSKNNHKNKHNNMNHNENSSRKNSNINKNDIYNNNDNMIMVVKKKKEKNYNNLDISYLEKKRNTNLFIKKIFHIIKNIFQKKDFKEPIEINVSDIIENELLHNKKLLEKNLDSYNIRNFFINNKKIYLLNESEYSHLRELINYKNKMLSYLNGEYKKYKHTSQYNT